MHSCALWFAGKGVFFPSITYQWMELMKPENSAKKQPLRGKLDLSRLAALLLAKPEPREFLDISEGADIYTQLAILNGVPVETVRQQIPVIREQHSALVAEFREKASGIRTENTVVIIDSTKDITPARFEPFFATLAEYHHLPLKMVRARMIPVMAQHSALVAEFREKTRNLDAGKTIVILDRTKDMETPEIMKQAILDAASEKMTGEQLKSFAVKVERHKSLLKRGEDASCCRLGGKDMPDVTVVFPQSIYWPGEDPRTIGDLGWIQIPLRDNVLQTNVVNRRALYHEAFGHGTESIKEENDSDLSNDTLIARGELRADIAGIAGICRDTGNTKAAQALIAVRDLHALGEIQQPGIEVTLPHANGHILRHVLADIEAKMPAIRKMDDQSLLAFVNETYDKYKDDVIHGRRWGTVQNAFCWLKEASKGKTGGRDFAREYNPKCYDKIMTFLEDCAESLCFLYEVEPGDLRKKLAPRKTKAAAPTPGP